MRFVYFGLRFFSAIDHRLRQRLTALGWIVFVGAAIAALAGIDTSQTATYQAFTLFAALIGLAIAGSAFFRARASIERELPRYLTAGEPCPKLIIYCFQSLCLHVSLGAAIRAMAKTDVIHLFHTPPSSSTHRISGWPVCLLALLWMLYFSELIRAKFSSVQIGRKDN